MCTYVYSIHKVAEETKHNKAFKPTDNTLFQLWYSLRSIFPQLKQRVIDGSTQSLCEQDRDFVEMAKKGFIPNKLKPWIEARNKYHLSHAQIQMARELGLNPKKFGGMANHKQELWKVPLSEYIEHLYEKHFGKTSPDDVRPLEIKDAEKRKRKAKNKMEKLQGDEAIT